MCVIHVAIISHKRDNVTYYLSNTVLAVGFFCYRVRKYTSYPRSRLVFACSHGDFSPKLGFLGGGDVWFSSAKFPVHSSRVTNSTPGQGIEVYNIIFILFIISSLFIIWFFFCLKVVLCFVCTSRTCLILCRMSVETGYAIYNSIPFTRVFKRYNTITLYTWQKKQSTF